jgi:hypothetical protein
VVLILKRFPMRLNSVPWYIVSEKGRLLLDGFIMESTNSCGYSLCIRSCFIRILNFVVEILLILTYSYELASTDQTMKNSPIHVIRLVGIEVQVTTCMSRFPVLSWPIQDPSSWRKRQRTEEHH